jgi:hypothetical protein
LQASKQALAAKEQGRKRKVESVKGKVSKSLSPVSPTHSVLAQLKQRAKRTHGRPSISAQADE